MSRSEEDLKERLIALTRIISNAVKLFNGDAKAVEQWLCKPNKRFMNFSPFSMALSGKGETVYEHQEYVLKESAEASTPEQVDIRENGQLGADIEHSSISRDNQLAEDFVRNTLSMSDDDAVYHLSTSYDKWYKECDWFKIIQITTQFSRDINLLKGRHRIGLAILSSTLPSISKTWRGRFYSDFENLLINEVGMEKVRSLLYGLNGYYIFY